MDGDLLCFSKTATNVRARARFARAPSGKANSAVGWTAFAVHEVRKHPFVSIHSRRP
jgi:hypothetical protein